MQWLSLWPWLLLLGMTVGETGPLRAEESYALVAELTLAASAEGPSELVVTSFTATRNTGGFPAISFEPREVLTGIVRLINPPKLQLPLALDELIPAVQRLDPHREWLPLRGVSPQPGSTEALLHYRYRSQIFTINVHVHGEDPAALPESVPIESEPAVVAGYRGTPVSPARHLTAAVREAATIALQIARDHALVPGGAPGDRNRIRQGLRETFLLPVPGVTPDYAAQETFGRASGLIVQPVFIPRAIDVELNGWATFEEGQTESVAARLKQKRTQREERIRAELASLLPAGYALVTPATVAGWRAAPLGKKYALYPLRYESETLVLAAADLASVQTYVLSVGAAYDATDGLQGTASAQVLHDRRTHLEAGIETSYGAEADSHAGRAKWTPRNAVRGWDLAAVASVDARRQDQAFFGAATDGTAVRWRRWRADVGLTARRDGPDPLAGQWESDVSAGLHLIHADDTFDAAVALPANAALPDSFVEFRAEWRTQTLLAQTGHRVGVGAQVRFSESIEGLEGNHDYRVGEVAVNASLVTSARNGRAWKAVTVTRAGRLNGTSPLSRQFRAGGDNGWIRGLQEGELIGRAYWAQSLAAGPEVSSLFGGRAGRSNAFLLGFFDWGQVQDDAGSWRSAQGFGVAVELDHLPLGPLAASLLLGYAYSPDSAAEPHGAMFLRIDLPFVQ